MSHVDPSGNLEDPASCGGYATPEMIDASDGTWEAISGDVVAEPSVVEDPSDVGAARRLIYEASPKHGPTAKGSISAAPRNGQEVLDSSIQVKSTSPRRVGIDYETGEFNVFDQTSEGIFHGHVRTWDQLTPEMQRALRNAGMVDSRGRILEGQ